MPKSKIAGIIVRKNHSMFEKPIHCMGEMTNLCRNLVRCPYKNNPTVFCGIWPSPFVLFCFVCFVLFVLFQGETRLDKSKHHSAGVKISTKKELGKVKVSGCRK